VLKNLLDIVFGSSNVGRAAQVQLLPAWAEAFNSVNGGRNGRAQVHADADPNGGHDRLRYVNVVFGAAARAFGKCTFRVLDIDAAHLNKTRKDLRYIVVAMHTTNNKILPLCFHLCFGETTLAYEDMLHCLLSYNEGPGCLRDLIDSKLTRINGDRHCGLRAAIERRLQHGNVILHTDIVHLMRNVHDNVRLPKTSIASANALIKELASTQNHADLDTIWERISVFNSKLHDYLLNKSDPRFWIAAYFDPVFDACKWTSNGAEIMNSTYKRHGLRSMMPVDMLDGVCSHFAEVCSQELLDASTRLASGCQHTEYFATLVDAKFELAKSSFRLLQGYGCCDLTLRGPHVCVPDGVAADAGARFILTYNDSKGRITCNHCEDWMTRFGGISCEHKYCYLQTGPHATEQCRDAVLMGRLCDVDEAYSLSRFNEALDGHIVIAPLRASLDGKEQALVFPECTEANEPGRGEKRYRGHGELPSLSTAAAPRPATRCPIAAAAQTLLRHGVHTSKTYLLLRYQNKSGNSSSTFGNGVSANGQMRPFRYIRKPNQAKTHDTLGRPIVWVDSMLEPPGPRMLFLWGVKDCLIVSEAAAIKCAGDGSWTDPRTNQVNAAISSTTAPTPATVDPDGAEEFEIQAIIDEVRVDDHTSVPVFEFLVRWAGCTDSDDQWLTQDELAGCQHVVQTWMTSARRKIFSANTEPELFKVLKVSDVVQVFDNDLLVWQTGIITRVCNRSRHVKVDGSRIVIADKQIWLRQAL
jgi:hypothetical protein